MCTLTLACDFNYYVASSLSHLVSVVEQGSMNGSAVNFYTYNSTGNVVLIAFRFHLPHSWSVTYMSSSR